MQQAQFILGRHARLITETSGTFDLSSERNVVEALLSIMTRHPMCESNLLAALEHWLPGQAQQTLENLRSSGRLQVVTRRRQRFWSVAQANYNENID